MGSLSNQYISQSYTSLIHLGSNTSLNTSSYTELEDGLGNGLNIFVNGTDISSSGNIYGANLTGSGATINTGSFATTGSNTFYGDQIISGSGTYGIDVTNGIKADYFYTDTQGVFTPTLYGATSGLGKLQIEALDGVNINGHLTASLQEGYVWVGDSLNKTKLVATASFFVSGSGPTDISALNQFTASQYISNSFFATTGSNQFNGSQSISGSVTLSGSLNNVNYIDFNTASAVPAWKSGRVFWDNTDGCLAVYNAEADITLQVGQEQWVRVRNNTGVPIVNGAVVRLVGAQGDNPLVVLAAAEQMSGSIPNTNQILGIATHTIENTTDGYVTVLGNVRGLNTNAYNEGDVLWVSSSAGLLTNVIPVAPYERIPVATVIKKGPGGSGIIYVAPIPPIDFGTLSSVEISGSYTNQDVWIYEGNVWKHKNKEQIGLTTTSSFNSYTSSTNSRLTSIEITTASLNTSVTNLNQFTSSANSRLNNLETTSASVNISISNLNQFSSSQESKDVTLSIVTSSLQAFTASQYISNSFFATTASNTFTGDQTLVDASGNSVTLSDTSGSLMLVAKTFTSASAHLSSSANTFTNLIFKTNNNTADTIISGSNNIFTNPSPAGAGLKRYLTSNNIALTAFPQISSSMQFSPTISNNYFNGAFNIRGPVSASAFTISGNTIAGTVNIGPAGTHAQGLTSGFTMNQNIIPGTFNITANQASLTGSTTIFSTNYISGQTNLTLNQSAGSFTNNIINDSGFVFLNNYFSQSVGLGIVSVNRNNIAGQVQTITITGSQPVGTTNATSYSDNFIGGGSNTLFVDASTTRVVGVNAYHSALRNIIFGTNLIISGSSLTTDTNSFGSAYFGRWNANDGIRNKTSDIVFAVGTGNSTTRKTGFLIDSGSNSYFEGTVNVSGSLLINGSNVIGTFATTGSNSFNGNQIITGSLVVSGSSGGRFNTIDTTTQRIQHSLSFTGSRFNGGIISNSIDLENLSGTQFGFNQLSLTDSLTGNQFILDTNKENNFSELKLNARYTGSNDASVTIRNTNTATSSFAANATDISLNGNVKVNTGTNKTAAIVTVGSTGLTVTNSLATTNSIILVTTQNSQVAGDEYPAVVSSKTTGQFTINHNYGGDLLVAYLIINPT